MEKGNFEWVAFYKELANKILAYKNDRKTLVQIVERVFAPFDSEKKDGEKKKQFPDIDGFSLLGIINSFGYEKRTAILAGFGNEFGITLSAPTSFDGVPNASTQNSLLFHTKKASNEADNPKDIDTLWQLFEIVCNYSEDKKSDFCKLFEEVLDIEKNGIASVTNALFWVNPKNFIALNSPCIAYIYKDNHIMDKYSIPDIREGKKVKKNKAEKITGEKYLQINESLKSLCSESQGEYQNFMEFSHVSYQWNNQMGIENEEDVPQEKNNYWICAADAKAKKWDEFYRKGIIALGWGELGDLRKYKSQDEIAQAIKKFYNYKEDSYPTNNSLANWQFCNDIKKGDIIFVKRGKKQIAGCGVVVSDYFYDANEQEFNSTLKMNWLHNSDVNAPYNLPNKTLTRVEDKDKYKFDSLYIDNEQDTVIDDESDSIIEKIYTKADFLNEVFISDEEYETMKNVLLRKKNIILQGAPGVGKTFSAKRLAYSIMGYEDESRIDMVQFHQNYSYEDFIMGYKPTPNGGFTLEKGSFFDFCEKARNDDSREYFFIIDEINRGNLSKIFGELLMLLENDYRNKDIKLAYTKKEFSIPSNIYIIGMMNTADRSLAMIDYALRRRFCFIEMKPSFDSKGFEKYLKAFNNKLFENLIGKIKELNNHIKNDPSLGNGFCIGHSYFCNLKPNDKNLEKELKEIVEFEIKPMIDEYWFDNPTTADARKKDLDTVF